jgi:hypothetical protein
MAANKGMVQAIEELAKQGGYKWDIVTHPVLYLQALLEQ